MHPRHELATIGLFLTLVATLATPSFASDGPHVYLSLGTSLAFGFQPDGSFDNGYADQLYAILQGSNPQLALVKLGCPGETVGTFRAGGLCDYDPNSSQLGSQLAAATAFLRANRGRVDLVTIDIGANEILPCVDVVQGTIDDACVTRGVIAVASDLPDILSALRRAAGPGVPILAMNYYNPFVVFYPQELASESDKVLGLFNSLLGFIYKVSRVPVARVDEAFQIHTFDIGDSGLPVSVQLACAWTWMCLPAPGPDVHPNDTGYGVIAQAFVAALP